MWTLEPLLSRVDGLVRLVVGLRCKALTAKAAGVRLVTGVYSHVLHQVALIPRRIRAVLKQVKSH